MKGTLQTRQHLEDAERNRDIVAWNSNISTS